MMGTTLLSFVIPCYRSEYTIRGVIDEIKSVISAREGYEYEIITINDESPDHVYEVLKELAEDDSNIKVVNLAKNRGKDAAVFAGYRFVKGSYVINLDDDGQSPVSELWQLMDLVEADACDIATARYSDKKESGWRLIGSKANMVIESITLERPLELRLENFFVMKRFVVDEVIKYNNPFPYFAGSIAKTTDRIKAVPMEKRDRSDERSTGYTLHRSISVAVSGMTNFSVKPLRIATLFGVITEVIAFLVGMLIIARKLNDPSIPVGWSSTMAAILFSSGIEIMLIGIIGEYIGRIFISMNNVPQYVIKNTINI